MFFDSIDIAYFNLLNYTYTSGDLIHTRNHQVRSVICPPRVVLKTFPLISFRKIAWKKAIKEMEWFISGDPTCPDILLDWWGSQINPSGQYLDGYGAQWNKNNFNQIQYFLDALKNHPNTRRAVISTWNTYDMSRITETNSNPNTPTTCHGTILQGWVRNSELYLYTYQRSADIMLGVPHNWVQYWALGIWLAENLGVSLNSIIWQFGDLHLYEDPSHLEVCRAILASDPNRVNRPPVLTYNGSTEVFQADQFQIEQPFNLPFVSNIRPVLF